MNTPVVVGIIFTFFCIFMCRFAMRNYKKSLASESWPSVSGEMVKVSLWGKRNINGEMKDADKLNVEYKYTVKGAEFKNKDVAFYTLMYPETLDFAGNHPVNSQIDVYYNPHEPTQSVLIIGPRKGSKRYSDLSIAIIGILVGVAISISGWLGFIG
jgi:hypothetical protein